jgi:hypothetical protein
VVCIRVLALKSSNIELTVKFFDADGDFVAQNYKTLFVPKDASVKMMINNEHHLQYEYSIKAYKTFRDWW